MSGLFRPKCSVCGKRSSSIEVVSPDDLPAEWSQWKRAEQESFQRRRKPGEFFLIFSGVGGGNGSGDNIDKEQALRILAAFSGAPNAQSIHQADFYDDAGFCCQCSAFYCYKHWSVSNTGYGTCPKNHGKSLDPHWSPDD